MRSRSLKAPRRAHRMFAPTAVAASCLMVCALAVGGCGGQDETATASQQARVKHWLPRARDIDCHRRPGGFACRVTVRKRPVGFENWNCEFTRQAGSEPGSYSGAAWCDSKDGSLESLRETLGKRAPLSAFND